MTNDKELLAVMKDALRKLDDIAIDLDDDMENVLHFF